MPSKIPVPDNARHFRFAVTKHTFGVDPATGALTNLQLMAAGREAKGHGIYIDEGTLETAAACVAARGGRLKAYVTHNHAGPCSWSVPDMAEAGSELNIPGFFAGITAELKATPPQLVAEKFEFYDAFKANFKPQFDQLVEMARKTPDLLGLSVECWGYLVYVGKDGTEYSGEPDGVELLYNGLPALRITDLWAAAFVADGAATDGLFAQLSRLFGAKQKPADRAALATALTAFATRYAAEVPPAAPIEPASAISRTMKIIADLKAKITDPQRFAAAMAVVGNTPADKLAALTVGDVETTLAAQDVTLQIANLTKERDTLKGQLTTATTDLATANGKVTTLTTERDDWKRKFETLKSSGHLGKVDLGAGEGGGGAAPTEENPWLKGATFNRTRQAEILKADPTRAAALKAAASAATK